MDDQVTTITITWPATLLKAAAYADMHPSYLRQLAKKGGVASSKDAKGRWQFRKEDLDAFNASRGDRKERARLRKEGKLPAGNAYKYRPAIVKAVERVIKAVAACDAPEEQKAVAADVLDYILQGALAEWAAKESEKAAEPVEDAAEG